MQALELAAFGPVIPVIVIHRVEDAVPLAQALVAGGVRVLEVTLRTPVALACIEAIARDVPEAVVGAGTVRSAADAQAVAGFADRRPRRFDFGGLGDDRRIEFLAGDAAHQVSPFGARGANSGLQDTDNLAWKLQLVIAGLAPEALMDSYSAERVAAADDDVPAMAADGDRMRMAHAPERGGQRHHALRRRVAPALIEPKGKPPMVAPCVSVQSPIGPMASLSS